MPSHPHRPVELRDKTRQEPLDEEGLDLDRLQRTAQILADRLTNFCDEFCDELHKDYPSLLECWRWSREIHHLVEIGIDQEHPWPEVAVDLIHSVLQADEKFLVGVRQALTGATEGDEIGEPLLECGDWGGYGRFQNFDAAECERRLKKAGESGRGFQTVLKNTVSAIETMRIADEKSGNDGLVRGLLSRLFRRTL